MILRTVHSARDKSTQGISSRTPVQQTAEQPPCSACMHLGSGNELRVATHEWDVLLHEQHKRAPRDSSSQDIISDLQHSQSRRRRRLASKLRILRSNESKQQYQKELSRYKVQSHLAMSVACTCRILQIRGSVIAAAANKRETTGGEIERCDSDLGRLLMMCNHAVDCRGMIGQLRAASKHCSWLHRIRTKAATS